MQKIVVAVGSTRRPKVNAVQEALAAVSTRLDGSPQFEIVAQDVPSGVGHTPLAREETMAGARNRADELARIASVKNESFQYFVGLEGGLETIKVGDRRLAFLESWVYVTDGTGHGYFGQSGAISIPGSLARRVVEEGIELSTAIDELACESGIRDFHGAWGALTCGLINRQDAFRIATINAFAPFFNKRLYGSL
jgi:inosine/xanthosine triphosphatase